MTEITANLPKKGISVPPGQKFLQTNYRIEDAIFTARALRIVDKVKPDEAKHTMSQFQAVYRHCVNHVSHFNFEVFLTSFKDLKQAIVRRL